MLYQNCELENENLNPPLLGKLTGRRKCGEFNPIPVEGGGGSLDSPLTFLEIIQNALVTVCLIFLLFFYMTLTLGSKRGHYTYCLNALFYLYLIKSIFRPTLVIRFWLFIALWKALNKIAINIWNCSNVQIVLLIIKVEPKCIKFYRFIIIRK